MPVGGKVLDVGCGNGNLINAIRRKHNADAYGLDISPQPEPLEIGDRVEFFGEYIWNRHGGAVHWIHDNPKDKCDDGYVKSVTDGYNESVTPTPLGFYLHYKGNLYEVIGFAVHSETLEDMVIYKALYSKRKTWVRMLSIWEEFVEFGGKMVKRFTSVEKERV